MRPEARAEPRYGQLYMLTDGRVVAVRSRNQAYMAFDPSTGKHWSHDAIYELSPFAMLDAQAKPHQQDVQVIADAISNVSTRYSGDRAELAEALEQGAISGVPSAKQLESALDHPNPAVRTIAQRLVTILRAQVSASAPSM